jgi:type VI protein secretion system component Hcp
MPIDQATVGLLSDLAKSTKLAKLTVDFRQAGVASPYTYLTYKFTNAYVTSFLLRDDASGVSIQVTFDFEQIAATYYTQKADGSTSAGAAATWSTGLTKSG